MNRALFGRWLDRTLTNEDIPGRKVAEALNVTDSAVSRWRSGQVVPELDKLPGLAELLGVDLMRLMATAGVPGMTEHGEAPLPIPRPDGKRDRVVAELNKIKGLDEDERVTLVAAYDKLTRQKDRVFHGQDSDAA